MKSFSAHITTSGDASVGIRGGHLELVFHGFSKPEDYNPNRDELRRQLAEIGEIMEDFSPGVRFSDECADCGDRLHPTFKIMGQPICINDACPSRKPEETEAM